MNTMLGLTGCLLLVAYVHAQGEVFQDVFAGNTNAAINAGDASQLAQKTALQKQQDSKLALQNGVNQGVAANTAEQIGAQSQVIKGQGLEAKDYLNVKTFDNADIAQSVNKGDHTALNFVDEEYFGEKGAFSIGNGVQIATGEEIQAADNLAKQEAIDVKGVDQTQIVDQQSLNAALAEQDLLSASDSLQKANTGFLNAQDNSIFQGGAQGGFDGFGGGFGSGFGGGGFGGGGIGGGFGNILGGGGGFIGGGNSIFGNGFGGGALGGKGGALGGSSIFSLIGGGGVFKRR